MGFSNFYENNYSDYRLVRSQPKQNFCTYLLRFKMIVNCYDTQS